MPQLPAHFTTIVFTRLPIGSYCRAGVAYRVERRPQDADFRFVDVATGSSTYDRPRAVARSVWTLAF